MTRCTEIQWVEGLEDVKKIHCIGETAVETKLPTLDGRNLMPVMDVSNPVNNGINYQPQLVSLPDSFHQQYLFRRGFGLSTRQAMSCLQHPGGLGVVRLVSSKTLGFFCWFFWDEILASYIHCGNLT